MAADFPPAETARLIEQLEHQKQELERQNQELRQSRHDLEQAQAQARTLQETLEAVLQTVPLAMGFFDREGRPVRVNQACRQLCGWSPEELATWFARPLSGPAGSDSTSLGGRALAGETLTRVEMTQSRRDGAPVDLSFSASPLYAATGEVRGFIGLAEDVTAQKDSQRAGQTQARVLANMAEGVVVTNSRGEIVYTNPAFDAMFGFEPGELLGLPSECLNAYSPQEYRSLVKKIVRHIKQTGSWHGEFFNRNKFGAPFYTQAHISLLPGNGQKLYISVQEDITERKLAAEALHRERDFSAALLDTLGALVVVLDRKGQIVRFNHTCEALTGYTFAEVQGQPFFELFLLPDETAPVRQVFEKLMAGDFPNTFENHWRTRTGQKHLISWSNTTLLDQKGAVLYVIGTGIDITGQRRAEEALHVAHAELERRVSSRTGQLRHTVDKLLHEIAIREQAEAKLKASEARFAAFMRYLPGSAIMRDRQGRFLFVNESWEKIMGRHPGESLGKTVFDFWPQDIAQKLHSYDQQVFQQNRPIEVMVELPMAGKMHTFLSYRFPIRNEAGEVEMVGAIGIDITARLKAEEARDRLIEIMEATPDFVGSADRDGRLFYLNRAAKMMLGLTGEDDITALTFETTQPAWAVELVLTQGRPIYAREGVWQGDTAILRRDGSELPVSQVILAHRGAEGKIKFFSTICRDITEMKRAEEKLRRSEEKLRLLATQLLTAQEDERKRLASELHDELGHALVTLKLHLGVVERSLLPEQRELREKMRQMEEYLTDTVEEVRRLYHALSPGDLEDLGLTTALRNMVEDFRESYAGSEWDVDLIDLDHLFPLPVQTMIYRVVQEALTNIGKHAYPDHVNVKVTQEDEGVVFVIDDDGRGFAMDDVLEGEKRGMGLAAMAQRVSLAGGIFDLWSRENQGTRITFKIPVPPSGEAR